MAEPWNPWPEDPTDAPVELGRFKWTPSLHPRIPGGKGGGGRFMSIGDPLKRRAAMAQSKLADVRQAAEKKVRDAGPVSKDHAGLAKFKERWQGPRRKSGKSYVRVGEKGYSPMMDREFIRKRQLGIMSDSGKHVQVGRGKKAERLGVVDREEIEDATPAKIAGEVSRTKLGGGMMNQAIHMVTKKDGSKVVHKIGDVRSTDAEVMSTRVGDILGMGDELSRVTRLGRNQHSAEFMGGATLAERGMAAVHHPDLSKKIFERPSSYRIGALDFLTGNPDRNLGNIMITDHQEWTPAAIDMGEAFRIPIVMPDMRGREPNIPSNEAGQVFSHRLFKSMEAGKDPGFNPHDWTADLKASRPEFEAIGHTDWHDQMMARHGMLTDFYDQSFPKKAERPPLPTREDAAARLQAAGKIHKTTGGTWKGGPKPEKPNQVAIKPDAEHAKAADEFEVRAKAFADGELRPRNVKKLEGGAVNLGVHLVEFEDGKKVVTKSTDVPNEPEREAFISRHLGPAVGVPVPHAVTTRKGNLTMDFAEGDNGEKMMAVDRPGYDKLIASEEFKKQARRIGAMDMISGNPDRNEGNWIWKDGKLTAIDNAMGFQPNRFNAKKVYQMGGGAGPWARDAFDNIPTGEWKNMRAAIQAAEPRDDREKGYQAVALSNINAVIKAKEEGTDWAKNVSAALSRDLPIWYNWSMHGTVVDLAGWNPHLHPRGLNGRFLSLGNSSRGWEPDPFVPEHVDTWTPDASRRRAAEGLPGDPDSTRRHREVPEVQRAIERDRADQHIAAIDEYNERFWHAAGVEGDVIPDQNWYGSTDSRPFRQAVVDAAPRGQQDRLRDIVHDEDFEDADLRTDMYNAETRQDAAQATLNRAFGMWERRHGTGDGAEWFASEIRPDGEPDSNWDGDDDSPILSEREAEATQHAAEQLRLSGNIQAAQRREARLDAWHRQQDNAAIGDALISGLEETQTEDDEYAYQQALEARRRRDNARVDT